MTSSWHNSVGLLMIYWCLEPRHQKPQYWQFLSNNPGLALEGLLDTPFRTHPYTIYTKCNICILLFANLCMRLCLMTRIFSVIFYSAGNGNNSVKYHAVDFLPISLMRSQTQCQFMILCLGHNIVSLGYVLRDYKIDTRWYVLPDSKNPRIDSE